jgi:hypothetical protein
MRPCPASSLLPTRADITIRLLALLRHCTVTGAEVFDVQIVAAMQANGARRIYTFNESDFQAFNEIQVLRP